MKINTLFGKLAGKSSHFVLSKLGRGSTLPGKLALKFDNDILNTLARDYEVVVITGTNGKTLTTALTVGILKEAFGEVVTNPSGANMISGIATTFLTAKKGNLAKISLCWKLMKLASSTSVIISDRAFSSLPIFSVTRWTAMVRFTRPTK